MSHIPNNNPTTLTSLQEEVLNGLMLGDGCLGIRKQCINPRLTIRRQSRDIEYLNYTFNIFRDMCRDKAVTTGSIYDQRYDKTYTYCNLESRYIPAFKPVREKWYPNGKKIVPLDLKLPPLTIAIWLADDGFVRSIKSLDKDRVEINFFTQGFTKDEVYFLKSLLDDRYNVSFKIRPAKNAGQYTIHGFNNQARPLLLDIDSVFPESMSRKSEIWRTPEVNLYSVPMFLTKEINATGIRSNVLNYMKEQNTFSTKDICRDLGYFYSSRFGKFFANSTVIKYMKKCFDDGVVIATNNDLKVLLNTKLKYVA